MPCGLMFFAIASEADSGATLTVSVSKAAFVGKGVELVVSCDGTELFVFLPREKRVPKSGEALRLSVAPRDARLLMK